MKENKSQVKMVIQINLWSNLLAFSTTTGI